MDKNSIIGLLLIGGILLTFGVFNMGNADEATPVAKLEQGVISDSVSNTNKAELVEEVATEVLVSSNLIKKLDVNNFISSG